MGSKVQVKAVTILAKNKRKRRVLKGGGKKKKRVLKRGGKKIPVFSGLPNLILKISGRVNPKKGN